MMEYIDYERFKDDLYGWLYRVDFVEGYFYRTFKLEEAIENYNSHGTKFYIYEHQTTKHNQYMLVFWKKSC